MRHSYTLALLGFVLPQFSLISSTSQTMFFSFLGLGYSILFQSGPLGYLGSFIGIFPDPRILFIPSTWVGFGAAIPNFAGLSSESLVRAFFSDSVRHVGSSISIYGLLFTSGLITAVIGSLLIKKDFRRWGLVVLISGGSILGAQLLFFFDILNAGTFGGIILIPIAPVFLLIAGALEYLGKGDILQQKAESVV